MKKEFTPGHFFMNRSLIWGRDGEVGGGQGSKVLPGGSQCPGGASWLMPRDTALPPSSRSLRGDHEGSAVPPDDPPSPRHTDVGEEEEDAGEQGDDLPGQAQVVGGGGVRVGGLRGKKGLSCFTTLGQRPGKPPCQGVGGPAGGLTGPSMGR